MMRCLRLFLVVGFLLPSLTGCFFFEPVSFAANMLLPAPPPVPCPKVVEDRARILQTQMDRLVPRVTPAGVVYDGLGRPAYTEEVKLRVNESYSVWYYRTGHPGCHNISAPEYTPVVIYRGRYAGYGADFIKRYFENWNTKWWG